MSVEASASRKQRRAALGALAGFAAALAPILVLRGFTVDDALITARVAAHIAQGAGYRFNLDGPVVDAVTPLGVPYLLAPFGASGPLAALAAARWLGALAWLGAASWLGARIAALAGSRLRFGPLSLVAVSAPLAAWAVSGMETGLVTALTTFALGGGRLGLGLAGLAAGLRPELIPWAMALAIGNAMAERRRHASYVLLALAPAVFAALLRVMFFGRAAPLAVFAKPSDLQHGLYYAVNALWHTGLPWLLLACRPLRDLDGRTKAVAVAIAAHWVSMLAAGGDWMALYRLSVPMLPSVVWVGAAIAARASAFGSALRLGAAAICSLWLFYKPGLSARGVAAERAALIEAARPLLSGARSIAALDIGWVGAATPAKVVDLAGLTDPSIAMLPGGHTSKHIPEALLAAREVDAMVLLLERGQAPSEPWQESRFAFAVSQRVATFSMAREFAPVGLLPLASTGQSYLVVRRRAQAMLVELKR